MKYPKEAEVLRDIQPFLVVGERIDSHVVLIETKLVNLLLALFISISFAISFYQAVQYQSYWIFASIILFFFAIYYLSGLRVRLIYAVTKFRVVKLEINLINRFLLRSWGFSRFSDLHFSHAETIEMGVVPFNSQRFWLANFSLGASWLVFNGEQVTSFLDSNSPFIPMALLLFFFGSVNLLVSLPLGNDRMIIHSLSGRKLTLPLQKIPTQFIEVLVERCRTYLTFGVD
ncbi:MAG: hypothetical protein D6732_03610 [Methanobacteriota archaeon]|nr:MAG: hypothetical protein D6732_03610 [Euryarchaeota archaeon]